MVLSVSALDAMTVQRARSLEEVAIERVRNGSPPILRFWRAIPRALTVGRFQCLRGEVDAALASRLGIPIVRRMSGGGAVLNDGEGEFAFSLTAPSHMLPGGITGAYRSVLGNVDGALKGLGLDTVIDGTSILVRDVGKVTGSSMRWTWDAVQVHGTVLYSMDPDLMKRLLWGGRFGCVDGTPSIRREVAPVGELTGASIEDVFEAVRHHLVGDGMTRSLVWTARELQEAARIQGCRYSDPAWNERM